MLPPERWMEDGVRDETVWVNMILQLAPEGNVILDITPDLFMPPE